MLIRVTIIMLIAWADQKRICVLCMHPWESTIRKITDNLYPGIHVANCEHKWMASGYTQALPIFSDGHSEQVGFLVDAGTNKQATIGISINGYSRRACVLLLDEIFSGALKVIEAVLFTIELAGFMPRLSILTTISKWFSSIFYPNESHRCAQIDLMSVSQGASLGDYLVALAYPIEKVTLWEGLLYLERQRFWLNWGSNQRFQVQDSVRHPLNYHFTLGVSAGGYSNKTA